MKQKGFAHLFLILGLLVLLAGIGVAAYLTQFTQVFKPKASETAQQPLPDSKMYIVMNVGNAIPTVDRLNEMVNRLGRGSDGDVKVGFSDLIQFMVMIDRNDPEFNFKDTRIKSAVDAGVATKLPFLFFLSGTNPFYWAPANPDYGLHTLLIKDDNNLAWDQNNEPYLYPNATNPLYKSVTYSQLNTEFYNYRKRNLQQAARKIIDLTATEPAKSLFVGVSIDSEIHLDNWVMPGKIYDYNPKAVGEFRLWLCGDCGEIQGLPDNQKLYMQGGKYAGKGKNMTLAQINSQFNKNFASWGHVDPARPAGGLIPHQDPWWQIWHEFRVLMVKHVVQDTTDWLIEAGIPKEKIYTHQVPGAHAVGIDVEVKFASPLETAEVVGANSGFSLYTKDTADESKARPLYERIRSKSPNWGVMEFNPWSKDYATNKKALDLLYEYGAKVVAPFQWDMNPPTADSTGLSIIRNSKSNLDSDIEKAFIDFVKEHSNQSTQPFGWLGSASCTEIAGWACDPNDFNQPLKVEFYDEGEVYPWVKNGYARKIGEVIADKTRDPGVAAACGGKGGHEYFYPTPEILKDGKVHKIYAYAQNIPTGTSSQLITSPLTLTCAPTPTGALTASPNPCPITASQTNCGDNGSMISWQVTNPGPAGIIVKRKDGATFAGGALSGSAKAWFITQQEETIELYTGTTLLDSIKVKGVRVNSPPKGVFDGVFGSQLRGWTCDLDVPSTAPNIHVYIDDQFGWAATTGEEGEDSIAPHCGGFKDRRIKTDIPDKYKDGKTHSAKIYALDNITNGTNTMLNGSPKNFKLDPPPPTGTLTASPNPCQIKANETHCTSKISWNVNNPGIGGVTVKVRSSGQGLAGGTSSGSADAAISIAGETFDLYNGAELVNSLTVSGNPPPTGQLTASPNPCQITTGTMCQSDISWNVTNPGPGGVIVKIKNGANWVGGKPSGTERAGGITKSGVTFELYNGTDLLDSLTVRGTPAVQKIGDLNPPAGGDGHVDIADFNIFARYYKDRDLRADFNGNGGVDLADLNMLIRNFGQ